MLILGGSATVTSLTGMNTIAVSITLISSLHFLRKSLGMFPDSPWSRYLRCSRWYARDSSLRLVRFPRSLPITSIDDCPNQHTHYCPLYHHLRVHLHRLRHLPQDRFHFCHARSAQGCLRKRTRLRQRARLVPHDPLKEWTHLRRHQRHRQLCHGVPGPGCKSGGASEYVEADPVLLQYWQRAIASRPASCVKAYLLGGLAWYASILIWSDVYTHWRYR